MPYTSGYSKDDVSLMTMLKKMCLGGAGGVIAKTVVNPIERVRILAQTGGAKGEAHFFNIVKEIMKLEGIGGFWRGNLVNCYRIFPHKAVLFSMNDIYKTQASKYLGMHENIRSTVISAFICASLAGMTYVKIFLIRLSKYLF